MHVCVSVYSRLFECVWQAAICISEKHQARRQFQAASSCASPSSLLTAPPPFLCRLTRLCSACPTLLQLVLTLFASGFAD